MSLDCFLSTKLMREAAIHSDHKEITDSLNRF